MTKAILVEEKKERSTRLVEGGGEGLAPSSARRLTTWHSKGGKGGWPSPRARSALGKEGKGGGASTSTEGRSYSFYKKVGERGKKGETTFRRYLRGGKGVGEGTCFLPRVGKPLRRMLLLGEKGGEKEGKGRAVRARGGKEESMTKNLVSRKNEGERKTLSPRTHQRGGPTVRKKPPLGEKKNRGRGKDLSGKGGARHGEGGKRGGEAHLGGTGDPGERGVFSRKGGRGLFLCRTKRSRYLPRKKGGGEANAIEPGEEGGKESLHFTETSPTSS